MGRSFAPQQHWDKSFQDVVFAPAAVDDPIRSCVEKWFEGRSGSVLELGCVPGTYLSVFGSLGYVVNGIDLMPRVSPDLEEWMKAQGYKTGAFENADVFHYEPARHFDVVCSFGLIEHFEAWPELIEKHASLTREGGYVMISTPNFRGWVQRFLHSTLSREDYALHNIEAMRPAEWAAVLQRHNFEVLHCGYLGRFDFWGGSLTSARWKRGIARGVRLLIPALRLLPPDVGAYAPYIVIVARKRPLPSSPDHLVAEHPGAASADLSSKE